MARRVFPVHRLFCDGRCRHTSLLTRRCAAVLTADGTSVWIAQREEGWRRPETTDRTEVFARVGHLQTLCVLPPVLLTPLTPVLTGHGRARTDQRRSVFLAVLVVSPESKNVVGSHRQKLSVVKLVRFCVDARGHPGSRIPWPSTCTPNASCHCSLLNHGVTASLHCLSLAWPCS